jgi:hypothetical protein
MDRPSERRRGGRKARSTGRKTMTIRTITITALGMTVAIRFGGTRLSRRSGGMQDCPVLRRRLDRHHGDHGGRVGGPGGARLQPTSGAVGAGHLRLAEEQGHRRLPRQLDADHGGRPRALRRRRSVEVHRDANLEGAKYTLAVPSYTYDAGLKSFQDIASFKRPARRQDLRHRAGQRRQPPDPRHDRGRQVRPRRFEAGRAPSRACWRRSPAPKPRSTSSSSAGSRIR